MKVLHFITGLNRGGVEMSLYQSLKMSHGDYSTNVVVSLTTNGPTGKKIELCGIPVHSLEVKGVWSLTRCFRQMREIIESFQPDILHCYMYHANLIGMFLPCQAKKVCSLWCTDMDMSQYRFSSKFVRKMGGVFSHRPDLWIANSHAGRRFHETIGYQSPHWKVISTGIDTDLFRPDKKSRERIRHSLGIPTDAFVIGLIARFDPMKDHTCFFRAAELLAELFPQTHFILAGKNVSDANPMICKMLRELRNRPLLHLLGESDDVPAITSALDIATSSSCWGEGSSNTVGEAMSCGVPCVVTDVGDSREIVGHNGITIPPNDPRALAEAWKSIILLSPTDRESMGQRSRERVVEHYNIKKVVADYQMIYQQLIR